MQTSVASTSSAAALISNTSVAHMLTITFRTQGIGGLYRGVSAPLLSISPICATSFWGYEIGQRLMRQVEYQPSAVSQHTEGDLTIGQKCIAGGFSALLTTLLRAPSERIKCLLQTSQAGQYTGMIDCVRQVYQQGGIGSIFRGTGLTLMRDIPGSMAWFGTYETIKLTAMNLRGIEKDGAISPWDILIAGGLAGLTCWTVSIPVDVIKSRYQSAPEGMYRNTREVYRQLIREEGSSAFLIGMRPALLRAFPANAACFFGMEMARQAFSFLD
jgi:solute carrier family 25 (mitochondrial carnitine/acylcarnitine transporter), member 20/29